jgi:hypothetical protein
VCKDSHHPIDELIRHSVKEQTATFFDEAHSRTATYLELTPDFHWKGLGPSL